jgi:hypothetical protein
MPYDPPMRRPLIFALLLLAACGEEPENIQVKAENLSRMLEERANELTAEAENGVDSAIAPLDNEAEALLNQANEAAPAENVASNAQ